MENTGDNMESKDTFYIRHKVEDNVYTQTSYTAMCYQYSPHGIMIHNKRLYSKLDKDKDHLTVPYVFVEFKHFSPTKCNRNNEEVVICKECQKDYLKRFLEELEK